MNTQSVSDAILASALGPQAPLTSQPLKPIGLPLVAPLQPSAAYQFTSSEALATHHTDKHGSVRYGRDAGENASQLDAVLEVLHPGFQSLSFSSGMSAIGALLTSYWPTTKRLFLPDEVYRKTRMLADEMAAVSSIALNRYGVFADATLDDLAGGQPGDVYFIELPTNPHLRLVDPVGLRSRIGDDATIILDATVSGLGTLAPAVLNSVDAVVYSCTKYIGGHNDVIGGSALVRPKDFARLWDVRSKSGTIISPPDAYLLGRSLRTFDVRFAAQVENTDRVLAFLSDRLADGGVERLYYPGSFSNADQAALAKSVLGTGGALLSFVPANSREAVASRMSELRVLKLAPSFGSVDSLLEITSLMNQAGVDDDGLRALKLEPNLVRLSVGIESSDRILEDLDRLIA